MAIDPRDYFQSKNDGYRRRNTPVEQNLGARRGRLSPAVRPAATSFDLLDEAMRSAAMEKRSHGREQGSPAGSSRSSAIRSLPLRANRSRPSSGWAIS
ncbi:MAG: hypothetical protein WD066_13165 [Planctomycetaceae bacterium]